MDVCLGGSENALDLGGDSEHYGRKVGFRKRNLDFGRVFIRSQLAGSNVLN